jgi:small subunit ribosomal protein S1
MKNALIQDETLNPPKTGDIIEGKIVGVGSSGLYIDLGILGVGIIYKNEFDKTKESLKQYNKGNKLFVKVIGPENDQGYFELSMGKAKEEIAWKELKELKEKDESIEVRIDKANKGGLIAESQGIQGFLPLSQLSLNHYPKVEGGDTKKIVQEMQKLIGQTLEVKILDLDQRQKKLIFSEKAKDVQNLKESLKNYNVNDLVEGKITGITDFGLFIQFSAPNEKREENQPPLEGLIHISEIDQEKSGNLRGNFRLDQEIKAKIIKIADDKIYLSLKDL